MIISNQFSFSSFTPILCIFGSPKVRIFDFSRIYKRRAVERVDKTENMRVKRKKAKTGKRGEQKS